MTAGEAAAATASYIAAQVNRVFRPTLRLPNLTIAIQSAGMDTDFGDSYHRGRSRSRHNSISGYGSSYSDSHMYNDYGGGVDPYAYDDGYEFGRRRHGRSRHGSRHRRHSMSDPMMMGDSGYVGSTGTMAGFGGGYAGSGYASSVPMAGSSYSSYGGGGGFPSSYPLSSSYPVGGSSYGGSYGGYGVPVSGGSQVIVTSRPRHRSKHRSSSRHGHHRSRSRSRGPIVISGGGYGGYVGSYY
jgi:hypothetical protein